MTDHRTTVERFFEQFAEAWKTNDGMAVATCFDEDGTLINPFGQRACGRQPIGAMYSKYFEGMLQGTTTAVTIEDVRPLPERHAFVDAEQSVLGPDGNAVLQVHLASLLRGAEDGWGFLDSRPYTVPDPPG